MEQITKLMEDLAQNLKSGNYFYMNLDEKEKNNLPINYAEEKDKYIIKTDVPGISKENIEINIKNNILEIKAERKIQKEKYNIIETFIGKTEREITLPDDADTDNIEALLENGVLTIIIPKKNKNVKKIEIKG
jgi:HSP20 family protein